MFTEDIYKDKCVENTYVSLSNYCLTSMILKDNDLKVSSYPFDWMVTCIDNIIHILEDNFSTFLNKEKYTVLNGQTCNSNICKLFFYKL